MISSDLTNRSVIVIATLLLACSGEDEPSDDGDVALACAADGTTTAPPGVRVAIEVVRASDAEKDIYLFGLEDSLPVCPIRLNLIALPLSDQVDASMLWSPDSLTLAYDAGARIEVVDLSGEAPGVPVALEHEGATEAFLQSWSPDGRWLAYMTWGSPTSDASSASDAWIVEVQDGVPGTPVRVTAREIFPSVDRVVWHPDGSGLVFQNGPDGSLRWLGSVEEGVEAAQEVADEGRSPKFDPTGSRLSFENRDDLLVADLDGDVFGTPRAASPAEGASDSMSLGWSPDGTHLIAIEGFDDVANVADVTQAPTPLVALNTGILEWLPDPDRFPGWVNSGRVFYETTDGIFVRDLTDEGLGPEQNLTPAAEVNLLDVAPDRQTAIFGTVNDEAEVAPFIISLAPDVAAARQLGDTALGRIGDVDAWFTPSGRRAVIRGRDEIVAFDLDEAQPQSYLVIDASDAGGIPPLDSPYDDPTISSGDRMLLWQDPPDRPAELLHVDMSGPPPWSLDVLLAEPPLEWTFRDVAWAPKLP